VIVIIGLPVATGLWSDHFEDALTNNQLKSGEALGGEALLQ
jgi:hypothetical protein